MSDWKAALREIDDDYLIGISNKGIVKRAYKDMETISCKIVGESASDASEQVLQEAFLPEDGITVNVGEETIHVRMPIGESTCSCPSRSICRHVVLGILALKEAVLKKASNEVKSKEIVSKEVLKEVLKEEPEQPVKEPEGDESDHTMIQKVMQQIADYPIEKLCKKLGTRKMQEFLGCARVGKRPQISYSSVVTVQPIAKQMSVRLLFPLDYSTCTCHKKEFCAHKAEAILWCKLESGQFHLDELEQEQAANSDYDMEQIQEVVVQMRTFLEELLDTGLSRTPQDALEYMERLAVICHNAKLPDFEGDWRRLQDSYNKYLKRVASFKIQMLMRQITALYGKTGQLAQAQNGLEVSRLAGAFRSEYTPAMDMDLVGIAVEHFVSKSGYEGETIYFLEENTKKWYTYTQARPVFYDNSVSMANYKNQRYAQETPWGLAVPFAELAFWHIHLEQAKCDDRGRLSSSRETKGKLIQDRRNHTLTTEVLGKWYYRDFAKLFQEQFMDCWDDHGTKLVFLRPESCDKAVFLDTEQKLYMSLYDAAGKAVVVEMVYSKDEAEGIRYLEKITNENLPCFFGKVYLRGGMVRMYPIAVFNKKELEEAGG